MSDCLNKNNSPNGKLPSWIRPQLFKDLLKKLYHNFEDITDFNVVNALAPGENYLTVMLKVEINMKLKDSSSQFISFMLKVAHNSGILDDFMKCHNVFPVEAGMFQEIVPEFEKLYAAAGMNLKFTANSYELAATENYILLENLKMQGFQNINRLNGLDRSHTECVLKKLAQWHAASAVRVATRGPFPAQYCTGFFKPETHEFFKQMTEANTKTLLECIKEYKNSDLFYDKVAKMQEKIGDELFTYIEPDLGEFNVLNHGDCWSNNIMFRYDGLGNIADTYFVDLQMPRYCSPVYDLIYLLLSSTELDIKLEKFDYFIKFYYDHLVENLKRLKYSQIMPTLKEIHQMIFKYGIYCFMTITNIMAAVLCDPTDNATIDNFVSDSEDGINFKRQMYSNVRYRSHMEKILPWLLNKGLLE